MYKIVFVREAEKEYRALFATNKALFRRIRNALLAIAEEPSLGKALKLSLKGKWSYRVGQYRIIYSIDHGALVVHVLDIGHRREAYK